MTKPLKCDYLFVAGTCILLSSILVCCSGNGANDQGEIFIKMVDAPSNYQQINIVVNQISIHRAGFSPDIGLIYLNIPSPISFNLLALVNGHFMNVLSKVATGTYDKINIMYGTCTISTDGINIHKLNLDSSNPNGTSLPYSFQIAEGQQFQLTFDFDANKSVYVSGLDYRFKPIIRVQNTALSGWIAGSVRDTNNIVAPAKITTFTGLDTVTTFNDAISGSFQLSDLPEDTSYTVIIIPENHLLMNDTLPGNIVIRQTATNLGIIQLKYK